MPAAPASDSAAAAAAEVHRLRAELAEAQAALARAEQQVAASSLDNPQHEYLQLALAASEAGVWVSNLFTGDMYCDARLRQMLGLSDTPLTHNAFWAHLHPADQEAVDAAFERAVREAVPFAVEFRVQHPQQGLRYITALGKVLYDPQHEPLRLTGLMHDITARHLTQQALHQKNLLLERLLGNLPLLLARFDRQGNLLEMTGAGQSATGMVLRNLDEPLRRVLAGDTVSFIGESERQGQPVYFQCYGFFDEQQECAILFSVDVTASEQMNNRLRTEKEFSESLLNHSIDAIVACDAQGRVTAWNRVMEQLSETPAHLMLGQPLSLFPTFEPPSPQGVALQAVLTGQSPFFYNQPFNCHDRDCEASIVPLTPGAGTVGGALVIIRDVTQRNRLTEETTRLRLRRQQEILAAVLTAQEEERRRIAEGLHNGVGQLLYAARLSLASQPSTQETRSLLDEAIRATRTISFELTPGVLADFGLKTAVEELTNRIPTRQLPVALFTRGLHSRLASPLEIAAYRMVQELLNNIIRHAHATEVTLHLVCEDGQLQISAEDNGVGFDTADLASVRGKGIGLASIRNRVDLLSGTLTINSRLGRGTIVSISLPVE